MRLLLIAALLALGCAHNPPTPPPPGCITDCSGGFCDCIVPTCATACARLERLGCPAAKPTPAGDTCEAVCANIEDSGVITYGVECVTTAPTCAAADKCGGPTK